MSKSISKGTRFLIVFLFISSTIFSQVGIGTTNPAPGAILDINSDNSGVLIPRVELVATNNQAPIIAPTPETGLLVFNTATVNDVSPGFYFWTGSQWSTLGSETLGEPPIDSVSLTSDIIINSTVYTDISEMTLTFTARKTSVLINLTASGLGYPNSIGIVYLRLRNVTDNVIIGGTMEKIQNLTSISGGPNSGTFTTTTWSASYSKLMTGLIIGNSYTLTIQGMTSSIYGTNGAGIQPVTNPDSSHLTLSVIQ